MAYPIKNTTSQQTNTVRTLNFAFGVNQGGYGLTSSTAFWNGRPPNVSGYTAYIGNGTSSPSISLLQNNTDAIQFATNLGCTYCTTIELSLFYILNSGTAISLNIEPPNIVTSGLTLHLDAGFTISYPKGLSTWYDISASLNNGTLINGPTYSSVGGGCIVSDGSDDGVTVPDSINIDLTNFTLDGWVWFNQHKDYGSLLVKGPGGAGQLFNYCFFFYANSLVCGFGDGSNFYSAGVLTTPNVPINTWHHIVGVYNSVAISFYLNGVLIQSNPIVATPYQNTNNLNVIQSDYPIDGKVISAKVYNRALSPTEILQNYYAGLQKLIPIDNLVLWLDGTNTNTRVITPTTAYDRSGNNYNGTFVNGTVLAHRDGGTVFYFDGVDDKLTTTLSTLTSSSTWTIWIKRIQSMNFFNMFMSMGSIFFAYRSDGVIQYSNLIGGVQQDVLASPSLVDNVWYSFAFVSSFSAGNTTMGFYLNGVLQAQSTFAGQQPTNPSALVFGDWPFASYPFNGKIGDVKVYSRALTTTELSIIYTEGKLRYGL